MGLDVEGEDLSGEALAEHGRRFLEVSLDLLAISDFDGRFVWLNAAWESTLGIPLPELRSRPFIEMVHPEDRDETERVLEQVVGGQDVSGFVNRYACADGGYRWLLWSSRVEPESELIYAVAKDVTELRESRRTLSEAQRVGHLGNWSWDPESGEVVWSDELYSIFGVDPSSFEPGFESYMAMVHAEDRPDHRAHLERLLRTGEGFGSKQRIQRADGAERVIFTRASLEGGTAGRRVVGVCHDVTETEHRARDLARTASLHRATLESTTDGILVVDREGKIVSSNRRFVEMWGLPEDLVVEGVDAEAIRYVADELRDPEGFRARIEELYSTPSAEATDVLEFKDGRVFERFCAPQRLDGEIVGRVWSFRDMTARLAGERERLALEARLQQSQRLESLGRLAGGVAHDFNNHLVAILNYAALAREETVDSGEARADLDEVIAAAERASALTGELVALSRQEMVEPEAISLAELVAGLADLLQRTVGERIALRTDLDPAVERVQADPGQLERVLMNLVMNAREAIADEGTITISAESAGEVSDSTELTGPAVRLRVSDTGRGMDEEVARRALEPFFTTKPRGQGTGLGLATVYGIVNQCGGQMRIESKAGAGTTVAIELPVTTAEPADQRNRSSAAGGRGPERGTVLVVEDEAPVRRLTARLLRGAGFSALESASGDEALRLLEREDPGDLCLLLTDIVMPRMSGRELAERVHSSRPELPVLFTSGYTDDVVVRHGVAADDISFLPKPFTRESLIEAVEVAIAG